MKRDVPDEDDVLEMIDEATQRVTQNSSTTDLAYSRGVLAALRWITGEDSPPFEEE